ncbi:MAG: NERD domain-containing protein [Clostridia bacterium]|nr:NERD domain-containing protein [Clostridia bacterium]
MSVFISIVTFALTFVIAARVLEVLLVKGYCSELLSEPKNFTSSLPSRLSAAVLPKSRIFRSVALPIPGRDGEEIQLGTVIVSRSGIFIVCQINGSGILENSPNGKWKHIYGGKCVEYENPFQLQSDARKLIDYYAECEGLSDIKAHSLIVYTSEALKFTYPKPRGIISAENFPKKLSYFEKRGRLSRQQIKAACAMLRGADSY